MTEEDTTTAAGTDIENPPSPTTETAIAADAAETALAADGTDAGETSKRRSPYHPSKNDPHKKTKVILLTAFIIAVIVVAIALGVTLGNKNAKNAGAAGSSASETSIAETSAETVDTTTETTIETPTEVTDTTDGTSAGLEELNPTVEDPSGSTSETGTGSDGTAGTETGTSGTGTTSETPETGTGTGTFESHETQYIARNGPLQTRIRMIDPSAADGYDSCDDLKDGILDALKFYANAVIMREMQNDFYEKCDPNNPDRPYWNYYDYNDEVTVDTTIDFAEGSDVAAPSNEGAEEGFAGGAAGSAPAKVSEDSFETNNQVEGVDEADVVKSDGIWVFAGYGDVLYAWNATNGSTGMSITKLPYNDTWNASDCGPYYPEPMPYDPIVAVEDTVVEVDGTGDAQNGTADDAGVSDSGSTSSSGARSGSASSSTTGTTSSSGGNGGNRGRRNFRGRSLSMLMPYYCGPPKPRILSLLLEGSRLTAIISEEKWYYGPYDASYVDPIIDDYTKLSIRVYDVSNVPTDGSPLTLLGETTVKGNYNSARSIGDTGVLISTSYVNTYQFVGDLYRSQPQYCGMNATEYEAIAVETAKNKTEAFMERMLDEMRLDGSCNNIFQISAYQSGNNSAEFTNENLLENFVQVLSFDMAGTFENGEIPTDVAGAFSSGYLSSVYVSQDFVGALNVGSNYNPVTTNWDQSTFVLGFDISGDEPKPLCVGQVSGSPLNQYAADLYDGHLRIATTEWRWNEADSTGRTTNKIFILEVPDGSSGSQQMVLSGVTDRLGKVNEDIRAVRFIGDKAFVVTYEQIDPFIVLDMSNHSNPVVVGELEIPGFSSYLHPIEIDGVQIILGIGQHVDASTMRTVGVKITLFNITNSSNPTEMATYVDENAYSDAEHDFKSFRYLSLNQKLILHKSEWTYTAKGNFDGFVVYDVNLTAISPVYEISHASSADIYGGFCWYNAYMPPRSLVFKSKVTTILSHTVISTDLDTGDEEWSLNLDEGLNNTECAPYFIAYYK